MDSTTENNRHGNMVRVKTCGKSARSMIAILLRGKPYWEQGKIARISCLYWLKRAGMPPR